MMWTRGRKWTAAAAPVVGALAWLVGSHLSHPGSAQAATPATVVAVQQRTLSVTAEASGTAEPLQVVEVKSRASGEVTALNVETGQQVKAGSVLAEIDPRDVRNAAAQADADLQAARVKVQTANAQKQRAELMRKDEVITQDEYEAAVLGAASAQADLVKAQTNAALAREKLGDVTITAPIAGTILERDVAPGQIIASASQTVSGGTTLFTMADLSRIQIRTLVDETDIGRIQPGQRARVSVEAYPGRSFTGTVAKVEPQAVVDQNVTMFPVLVEMDNREGLIKPGMSADVQIQIADVQDAVVVPNDAVVAPKDVRTVAEALGVAAGGGSEQAQASGHGGGGAAAGGAARRGAAGAGSAAQGSVGGDVAGAAGAHAGVVFVQTAMGTQARHVMLGLNDLDYTQVVSGLRPGERVVLATSARLQGEQAAQQDRMKQRAGGMLGARG